MEVRDFKTAAKVVADYLSRDGVEVSQSRMLEALSRGFGGRNWVSFRESLTSLTLPESKLDPVLELTATVGQLLAAMVAQEHRDSGLLEQIPAGIAPDWCAARDEGHRWFKLLSTGPSRAESAADVPEATSKSRPMFIPGIRTKEELAKAMPILKHLLRQMMFPLTPVDRTPPWEFAMLEEALKWVWQHHGAAAELKHVQEFLERHPDKRAHDMAFQLSPWVTKERLRWFDGVPESYVVEHGLDGIIGGASSGASTVVRDTGRGPERTVLVSGTLSAKSNGAQVEAQATLNLATGEVCTVWSPGVTPFPMQGCVDECFVFETEAGGKFPLPVVFDGTGNKGVEKKGREFVRYLMREQGPWQGH